MQFARGGDAFLLALTAVRPGQVAAGQDRSRIVLRMLVWPSSVPVMAGDQERRVPVRAGDDVLAVAASMQRRLLATSLQRELSVIIDP